jgi:transposase
MSQTRKNIDSKIKANVFLETIRNEKTKAQICSKYSVQSGQISTWKKKALESLPGIFDDKRAKENKNTKMLEDELYLQIGKMKVEIDFLKKKSIQLGL